MIDPRHRHGEEDYPDARVNFRNQIEGRIVVDRERRSKRQLSLPFSRQHQAMPDKSPTNPADHAEDLDHWRVKVLTYLVRKQMPESEPQLTRSARPYSPAVTPLSSRGE
jgi:hypothetical protein